MLLYTHFDFILIEKRTNNLLSWGQLKKSLNQFCLQDNTNKVPEETMEQTDYNQIAGGMRGKVA